MIFTWRHEHRWYPTTQVVHGDRVMVCARCGDRAYEPTDPDPATAHEHRCTFGHPHPIVRHQCRCGERWGELDDWTPEPTDPSPLSMTDIVIGPAYEGGPDSIAHYEPAGPESEPPAPAGGWDLTPRRTAYLESIEQPPAGVTGAGDTGPADSAPAGSQSTNRGSDA